jgi:hypothetical protein
VAAESFSAFQGFRARRWAREMLRNVHMQTLRTGIRLVEASKWGR